jgi:hypothetical protein
MKKHFYLALAGYAVIAVTAGITLKGSFRLAVWVLLTGLAVKTWLATRMEK